MHPVFNFDLPTHWGRNIIIIPFTTNIFHGTMQKVLQFAGFHLSAGKTCSFHFICIGSTKDTAITEKTFVKSAKLAQKFCTMDNL